MGILFPSQRFPKLQTSRLVLRELTLADNKQLLTIRSNADINRFIGRSNEQTIEAVNQFIQDRKSDAQNGKGVYWAIELKDNPGLIGTICFWNFDYNTTTAEIGYELLPPHQGKGIMREAIETVISFGFNDMHLETITACPIPQNERSVKLLEHNGFTYAETMDEQLVYQINKAMWQKNNRR